jgi:multiple sugar transport system ATP-binding protein
MADVKLENLSKNFGDVKAVDNLSLRIMDKEFLTLLGPSGSGKTTAMRLIAGLETPSAGSIYIGDRLVNDLPPKDRDVAMVFQSYALYPHMSVYDNLAFPLKMRKYSKTDIEEKVKHTAELLRINELLRRKPKQLSGGEQQRVALGRALVREPKVFLMDEPLSNLDAKLRLYMRAELKTLQKRLGITTIYVTHDQVEAMTMADRIALMDRGVLLQTGSPDDIYEHPANMFVGGFIGSPPMNFMNCSLSHKEDRVFVDTTFCHVDITDLSEKLKENIGSDLIAGIRPEAISVYTEKTRPDGFKGEVYVVEPLGSELILDIKADETILRARCSPALKISPGAPVWLCFDTSRLRIFDKGTERAIL